MFITCACDGVKNIVLAAMSLSACVCVCVCVCAFVRELFVSVCIRNCCMSVLSRHHHQRSWQVIINLKDVRFRN